MSKVNADYLYQRLPAIYRLRDGEEGPLRALIDVLAAQAEMAEGDVARLYENWFIETCGEWVIPYIGDLLGVRGLLAPERAGWSQRALIANTLQYRQRKGTVPLLEQLVRDVTGWAARAVELYNNVSVTQFLDHLRPGLGGPADLKKLGDAAVIGSAFDPLAYTPDVRLMSGTRQAPQFEAERPVSWMGLRLVGVSQGRVNLPNIGVYIWRLRPFRLERAAAYSHHDGKRFRFDPLGSDVQFFNTSQASRDYAVTARPYELPAALRNQDLSEELAARSQAAGEGNPQPGFFADRPVFEIYLDGEERPVEAKDLRVCDLGKWDQKRALKRIMKAGGGQAGTVYVDAELGRIFVQGGGIKEARVSYGYAFSTGLGGGPYRRLIGETLGGGDQLIEVEEPGLGVLYPLGAALEHWNKLGCPPATIQVSNNATYLLPESEPAQTPSKRGQSIELKGPRLVIRAADERRPLIVGDLKFICGYPGAELILSGLLISGQIEVTGKLGRLTIADCTLVPGIHLSSQGAPRARRTPSLVGTDLPAGLQVNIERSILGPILLPRKITELSMSDSIIDAPGSTSSNENDYPLKPRINETRAPARRFSPHNAFIIQPTVEADQPPAIAGDESGKEYGPSTRLERVTLFGAVKVSAMPLAEDVLFTAPVIVSSARLSQARYCYIPAKSRISNREQCLNGSESLLPAFTARCYGEPGYAQLSLACPAEIRAGGTAGAELGAFHNLHQPQREAALMAQLEEYLRFGLEAGLIYVS